MYISAQFIWNSTQKELQVYEIEKLRVLALTRNGKKESWLLSGWERITNADENSEVSAQTIPTQTNPTFSREDLGAALAEYKGKNLNRNSQNVEKDLSFNNTSVKIYRDKS